MAQYQVKFLFADASSLEEVFNNDISVLEAKQKIISSWPAGKDPISSAEDLKMIFSGKVLENTKTFADYKVPCGTRVNMHLQPRLPGKVEVVPVPDKPPPEQTRCCTIL